MQVLLGLKLHLFVLFEKLQVMGSILSKRTSRRGPYSNGRYASTPSSSWSEYGGNTMQDPHQTGLHHHYMPSPSYNYATQPSQAQTRQRRKIVNTKYSRIADNYRSLHEVIRSGP